MPFVSHPSTPPALAGYAADAAALIPRYQSVSPAEKLRHVAHLIPAQPARIVDIGAGTGVDAAWLAARGHTVLAVEPTAAFREAGKRFHGSERLEWIDDTLPALGATLARRASFEVVLISAVWAHVPEALRADAMSNIARLMESEATLIMSLRHGPSPASRPTYPVSAEQTIELARPHGMLCILHTRADSVQACNRAAGVSWDWLAFKAS